MNIQLPESFKESMKVMLGDAYGAYLDSFHMPSNHGLRVNTLKWTPKECKERMEDAGMCESLEKIPWISNGFFYKEGERMSKNPYYYAGLYYLQEPSAMTPASVLDVSPRDKILDLCAAPGGKSTELGARLGGTGVLFANDISNSRAKALLKNLELFGIANICVTSETPERLLQAYPEYFDKILVDAPCSGEGMFRKNPDMVNDWIERGPRYYGNVQREIMEKALAMLKPGGTLLYSTCTFSMEEDEEVILEVLRSHGEMELVPIPQFEGASDGIGLPGCIRLFPHKIRGEGHFLAMLRKKGVVRDEKDQGRQKLDKRKTSPMPRQLEESREFQEFLDKMPDFSDFNGLAVREDSVYYLPEDVTFLSGLRYLRTGLFVGTLKKGRFEPSQALAMTLRENTFSDSLSFSVHDDRVIRYLKGETIPLSHGEGPRKGWCLVCVDGFALGFAKGMGMTLKNKYYPGWRWM